MNWYLTKIVFRIVCGDGRHMPQFDEQLRLIHAEDDGEAFEKATEIGLKEQDEFFNQQQKLVQWKFVNVSELYKLSGLLDGAELYSTIQEKDNAELYMDMIHKKADHIRINNTLKFLEIL